jgi:MFS family permease
MADADAGKRSQRTNARIAPNVWALGAVSFFTDFATEMIYPLLPLFLTQQLGASKLFVGVLEGIAESVASLLKLVSGWLADRFGRRKPLVVAGYTLSSLSKPLVGLAAAPWHVLAVRVADRVGKGVRTAPRDALLADSVRPEERGRAFGVQRTMDHAGALLGPLLAWPLLAATGGDFRPVFAVALLPGLLCVGILLCCVREIPAPPSVSKSRLPTLTLRPFGPPFRRYVAILFLFTLGNSSDAFLLLRAHQVGVRPEHVPLVWVALHVVKMVASLPAGILSDHVGRRPLIVAGWTVYATVYLGLAFAAQTWQIWALFLFYGLYFGLTEGVEKAFVADLVPDALRGTAYGVFSFAVGVGAFPASVLMGALWEWAGPRAAFGFGAALALVAALLFLGLVRPSKRVADRA